MSKMAARVAKEANELSCIVIPLEDAQLLLLDTPGLHAGSRPLNAALGEIVTEVAEGCDVALLLVDLARGWCGDLAALASRLCERGKPHLIVGTKSDLAEAIAPEWPEGMPQPLCVSARTGAGIDALLDRTRALLPESPPLYPGEELSDRPMRFLAGELVREAAFDALEQELPYALAVEVIEYDEERPERVHIRANLLVERASQKQIAIGRNGRVVKSIGVRARSEIEKLVGGPVHLELWVKVEPRWSRRPKRLKSLGYI